MGPIDKGVPEIFNLMPLKCFCPISVHFDHMFYQRKVCDYAISLLYFLLVLRVVWALVALERVVWT